MIRFDDILEKVTPRLGEKDVAVLQKAYVFAARAHKGQVRRSGEPYLSHPLEVAGMLADMNLDRTTLVAGLLHDVLEDTDVTAAEIREAFGKDVLALVEGVTKISRVQDASPEARRAETIRKIILAMTDDLRVIFIKLADRIHNLKTLKFLDEEKQGRVARETLEIYAPIANRLGMGRIRAELEDLSFRYVAPEEYFKITALVEPLAKSGEKELRQFKRILEGLMKENGVPAEIYFRTKRPYSVWNKMTRRDIEFDQVFDFLALRLITDTVKNCYAALGIIHQKWPHLPQRFRDFIAMPKPNMYQALHTTVITEDRKTFEIQIRTREMHDLAENGISAHWKYKEGEPQSLMKDDKRLHWLREMVTLYEEQKNPREFLKNLKTNLIPDEVYVFTPKGKAVSLPPQATALDFAFKIHTEIGLHAVAARINGASAPLKTILKTGDIVEIATSPDRIPTRSWLAVASTSDARHQIKRWLNVRSRAKSLALGKKLWERETAKVELPAELRKEDALLARLSAVLNKRLVSLDEFYREAGLGKVVIDRPFLESLAPSAGMAPKKETFLGRVVSTVTGKKQPAIVVRSLDDPMISLGRCCSPIKGEAVIGYITVGKGITVHSLRCPLVVKEVLDAQRMVDVAWDDAFKGSFTAKLLVKSENTPGVLAKVATVISRLEGNITKAEIETSPDGKGIICLEMSVRDIRHLEAILDGLAEFKDVFSADRV
jgi:GTP diphosphokinase / guanosine-3',5'-bis(diphosphate) 3'-diphosphatase